MTQKPMTLSWSEARTLSERIYELKKANKESEHEYRTYQTFYGDERVEQLYEEAKLRFESKENTPDARAHKSHNESWP